MRNSLLAKTLLWICSLVGVVGPARGQFRCELTGEARPWYGHPKIDKPDYRFVLLADRTGGPDTGAFERAVDEINRLAPDFVVTIGDLIDGYVSDPAWSAPQWEHIERIIGRLEAPLFLCGGNHDLSNPAMAADWQRRFGCTYYHFTVGDDLFLVLDTEGQQGRAISPQQVAYFTRVLDNWQGRWIYVFMHRPLWRDRSGGYAEIEPLLRGRDYTLFSGHTHLYYMECRDGMEHYTVATTGGDSGLRGAKLGEVDHYLHITARAGRPAIANIPLGAMLPNDVVNPRTEPLVRQLFRQRNVRLEPVIMDGEHPRQIECRIEVRNPQGQPLLFTALPPDEDGIVATPRRLDLEVAAGGRAAGGFTLDVSAARAELLQKIPFRTRCGYVIDGDTVAVTLTQHLLTDCIRTLTGEGRWRTVCDVPAYVKEDWDWHGREDGSFTIDVERTKRELVITVTTRDDALVRAAEADLPQDRIVVCLADDRDFARRRTWEFRPDVPMRRLFDGAARGKERGECTADGRGSMRAVLRLPLGELRGERIRLNVGFTDSDDARNVKPSVLWWKPVWGEHDSFVQSGQFVLR